MLSILTRQLMSPQKLLLYNQDKRPKRDSGYIASHETPPPLNFTINYEDYGQENALSVEEITSGCAQYFALGKYYPNNVIDLLSKAIFEIDSFDSVTVKLDLKL